MDGNGGEGLGWLLALLRFASPTLPIGAFAFSRGLEFAVQAGWVRDGAWASDWVLGLLRQSGVKLDGALFVRLYRAASAGDKGLLEAWNRRLFVSREAAELRFEDAQLGAAFLRLLEKQGIASAVGW